ncbi:MAG: hypothetical protein ABIJ96_08405 [Elusimicrobiota bacterium]
MARKEVSEKTLEINICAELLGQIRGWPGCHHATWIGMKQDQEFRNGLDGLVRNAPGFHMMLQFKSPSPTPRDTFPYRFRIGGHQYRALRRLSNLHPHAVHYVFPLFNTLRALGGACPHLLGGTHFLPVSVLPKGLRGYHRVECDRRSIAVYSKPFKPDFTSWEGLMGQFSQHDFRKAMMPSGVLHEWIDEVKKEYSARQVGQMFRGMATVFVGQP